MFWNCFSKYTLMALRTRSMIWWTFLFPVCLSTLFYFTFSSIDATDQFHSIPVAVVRDQEMEQDAVFLQVLEAMSAPESSTRKVSETSDDVLTNHSSEEKDGLLSVTWTASVESAQELLESGDITGIIRLENGLPVLSVTENGLNQTILKSFLDQYLQMRTAIQDILAENPLTILSASSMFQLQEYTQEVSISKNEATYTVNYYYALIAMICLYGAFYGMSVVSALQGNLSPQGALRSVSPYSRSRQFLADMASSIATHFIILILVLLYIRYVLRINFGSSMLPVLLVCLIGGAVGVSFGALITVPACLKAGMKEAIIVCGSLICSFFSGLMMSGINYTVAQKAPLFAMLNPCARITDALYCLYYYDGYDRYFQNIAILAVMFLVMTSITVYFIRRHQYESI